MQSKQFLRLYPKKSHLKLIKYSVILLVMLLQTLIVSAQQGFTITGTVSDNIGPLPGGNVFVKGTNNGVGTDSDGKYSIVIPDKNTTLIFSFLGYQQHEVVVGNRTEINVMLQENTQFLDEIVITGYGGKQNRANLTSAISKVDSKLLQNRTMANPASALAGAAPGVVVQQTSGRPGAIPSIIVRGGTNFDGSGSPLIVVDGLVRSINEINPEDIESIEILKDASATAIYGARASNGVVLITTKRGKAGHSSINFTAKVGLNHMRYTDQFMDARGYLQWVRTGVKAAVDRYGVTNRLSTVGSPYSDANLYYDASGKVVNPRLDNRALYSSQKLTSANRDLLSKPGWESMIDPINPNDTLLFTNTNFAKQAFNNPSTSQDYILSMQGGNDKGTYYASLGYYTEEGLPVSTYYKRLTFTLNGDYKIKPWLTSLSSFNFADAKWRDAINTSEASYFARMLGQPPTQREKNDAGEWVQRNAGDGNPLINIDNYIRRNNSDKFTMSQSLLFDIVEGLKLKTAATWWFGETHNESFDKDLYVGPTANGLGNFNTARNSNAKFERTLIQNYLATLNYNKIFAEKHYVDLLGGFEFYDTYYKMFSAAGSGAPTDDFMKLGLTSTDANRRNIDSEHNQERIMSFLGRANYNYDQKYLFSMTFRRDGYSKLLNNRWGLFPGVSGGWLLHKENFFAPIQKYVSFAKLRGGYGINGNVGVSSIGPYTLQGVYGNAGRYDSQTGFYLTTLSNPDLRWEKTSTYEIATDLGFLENKLNTTIGYFNRLTEDKITTIAVPATSGVTSVLSNNGSFRNTGVEFEVNYKVVDTKDWSWTVGANATYIKNKVVKLPKNGLENNRQGGTQIYDPKTGKLIWVGGLQEGQEPYQVATWEYEGIWKSNEEIAKYAQNLFIAPSSGYSATTRTVIGPGLKAGQGGVPNNAVQILPGDARYKDRDGNDTIDYRDRKVIGSAIPKWTGGITTTVGWKGVSLYVAADYALGFYNYNSTDVWFLGMMQGEWNHNKKVQDTWTESNPNAKYPKIYLSDQAGVGNFARQSTLWWKKGDYLALRVVTLSYSLPNKLCQQMKMEAVKLSVTGQNLAYLTQNDFYTPESRNSGEMSGGSGYPLPRTYLFSASITF